VPHDDTLSPRDGGLYGVTPDGGLPHDGGLKGNGWTPPPGAGDISGLTEGNGMLL
jgi:hypothetical protein